MRRTPDDVTGRLVNLACAGIKSSGLREATAEQARKLCDEGYALVREDERRRNRRALAQAWGAWLDLMMSAHPPEAGGKSLLEDVLDLEPGLRRRFEEVFLKGEDRG